MCGLMVAGNPLAASSEKVNPIGRIKTMLIDTKEDGYSAPAVVYGKASIMPGSIESIPGTKEKLVSYQVLPKKMKFTDSVDASVAKPKGVRAIHWEDDDVKNSQFTQVRDKVYYYYQQ